MTQQRVSPHLHEGATFYVASYSHVLRAHVCQATIDGQMQSFFIDLTSSLKGTPVADIVGKSIKIAYAIPYIMLARGVEVLGEEPAATAGTGKASTTVIAAERAIRTSGVLKTRAEQAECPDGCIFKEECDTPCGQCDPAPKPKAEVKPLPNPNAAAITKAKTNHPKDFRKLCLVEQPHDKFIEQVKMLAEKPIEAWRTDVPATVTRNNWRSCDCTEGADFGDGGLCQCPIPTGSDVQPIKFELPASVRAVPAEQDIVA